MTRRAAAAGCGVLAWVLSGCGGGKVASSQLMADDSCRFVDPGNVTHVVYVGVECCAALQVPGNISKELCKDRPICSKCHGAVNFVVSELADAACATPCVGERKCTFVDGEKEAHDVVATSSCCEQLQRLEKSPDVEYCATSPLCSACHSSSDTLVKGLMMACRKECPKPAAFVEKVAAPAAVAAAGHYETADQPQESAGVKYRRSATKGRLSLDEVTH
eukprot:CAMPEP_0204372690 /NCGR_PEP_ID=MMETSP0469-20131031/47483_1 /ASSEMBLY_ACC=CAM_ASM_000384 /TAXON_ID=2969 /ORGANISM="Oxyrrhis marina" /LENGTH=218 /DNA_ID=CAMNT_0051363035 /DNA_START=51 /DNA_END=707 /DNA_ORIENTATION=-